MAKDCAIVCSKVGQCAGPYRCLSVQVGTTHPLRTQCKKPMLGIDEIFNFFF